jgi:predicted protein tyrosine phosphatase
VPQHEYRSAGVNTYFCGKKGTHLINDEDINWADVFVFAEQIHQRVVSERFHANVVRQSVLSSYDDIVFEKLYKRAKCIVLECGEYTQGCVNEDYLTKAELKLKPYITDGSKTNL